MEFIILCAGGAQCKDEEDYKGEIVCFIILFFFKVGAPQQKNFYKTGSQEFACVQDIKNQHCVSLL